MGVVEQFVQAELEGDVIIVTFLDRVIVTEEQFVPINCALHRLIDSGPIALVFDFSRVESFSSELLGTLINIKKKIVARHSSGDRACGGPIEVVPSAGAKSMADAPRGPSFRSRVFEIYPDRRSAIAALSESGPAHGWLALCGVRPDLAEVFLVC